MRCTARDFPPGYRRGLFISAIVLELYNKLPRHASALTLRFCLWQYQQNIQKRVRDHLHRHVSLNQTMIGFIMTLQYELQWIILNILFPPRLFFCLFLQRFGYSGLRKFNIIHVNFVSDIMTVRVNCRHRSCPRSQERI